MKKIYTFSRKEQCGNVANKQTRKYAGKVASFHARKRARKVPRN